MKELLTVVTRKGQITLPAEIRQMLGIKEGDRIAVSVDEAEPTRAIVRPVRSVAEMTYGAVAPVKRPEDFKALREAFEDETADEVEAQNH